MLFYNDILRANSLALTAFDAIGCGGFILRQKLFRLTGGLLCRQNLIIDRKKVGNRDILRADLGAIATFCTRNLSHGNYHEVYVQDA